MSRDFHTLLAGARGAALLCALVAALVHANTLGNRFAYDDVHILTENEEIQDARNLPRLMLEPYWPGDWGEELGLWRPGTTLALGLQWALWKDRGMPYHLVNVLAHALATARWSCCSSPGSPRCRWRSSVGLCSPSIPFTWRPWPTSSGWRRSRRRCSSSPPACSTCAAAARSPGRPPAGSGARSQSRPSTWGRS